MSNSDSKQKTPAPAGPAAGALRLNAVERLKSGTAPPSGGWTLGMDALALVEQMAGSPDSATHALKLLHELQVHQVELDLQHVQLEGSRQELAEDLERYLDLYEQAPVALLTVDADGKIVEANLYAGAMFGVSREHLGGRSVNSLFTPSSLAPIESMLTRLRNKGGREACNAEAGTQPGALVPLRVTANLSRDGSSALLAVTELAKQGDE